MLKTPFYALAPLANITTYPFASQCSAYGADLVWTPMVHTDTIINNWPEAAKILDFKDLKYFLIQLVGSEPENFAEAIKIIEKNGLEPLGYDLNAGCPDKNIVKSGCGGCLMKEPEKIAAIVRSMKAATGRPISVKTRAGFDNLSDIYELADRLAREGVWLLTVHPRTVKQAYAGKADWQVIKKLKSQQEMLIAGSGDVTSWQEAIRRQAETHCDGILIGRGALGKPWIFDEIKSGKDHRYTLHEIKRLVLDLADKANEIWGDQGIIESRKHFAWYFRGFEGAKETRISLMAATTLKDVEKVLDR